MNAFIHFMEKRFIPVANKISSNDRRDADQLKHYTGIEDKL